MASRLRDGINDVLSKLEVPGCAFGVSSVVHVRLGVDHECDREFCPDDGASGDGYDSAVMALLGRAVVNEGIWSSPSSFILSATHTEADVDQTVAAYESALGQVRTEGAI
jgi:glutamate-1-semialdehyde 2,1-aminomutase